MQSNSFKTNFLAEGQKQVLKKVLIIGRSPVAAGNLMGNALAAPFDAEAAVTNAQTAADTAFMLMSAALVLLMTGASLFYGGFVRDRNVLNTDDELRAHGNRSDLDSLGL